MFQHVGSMIQRGRDRMAAMIFQDSCTVFTRVLKADRRGAFTSVVESEAPRLLDQPCTLVHGRQAVESDGEWSNSGPMEMQTEHWRVCFPWGTDIRNSSRGFGSDHIVMADGERYAVVEVDRESSFGMMVVAICVQVTGDGMVTE